MIVEFQYALIAAENNLKQWKNSLEMFSNTQMNPCDSTQTTLLIKRSLQIRTTVVTYFRQLSRTVGHPFRMQKQISLKFPCSSKPLPPPFPSSQSCGQTIGLTNPCSFLNEIFTSVFPLPFGCLRVIVPKLFWLLLA